MMKYLLPLCFLLLAASCSEWDTDAVGTSFTPANSQVRAFTHLVFVEYQESEVRVWGPSADEVETSVEGMHITLQNMSDSLALFVYGYPATADTLGVADGSLTVESSRPYALYLSGLSLRSQAGAVLTSRGAGTCHIVLGASSRNHLYGQVAIDGPMTLSGTGLLTVEHTSDGVIAQSLQCQYGVSVSVTSHQGNGIRLTDGTMRISQGTWVIDAAQTALTSPDSIILLNGTYRGTALQGPFLSAGNGVMLRKPNLMAAAACISELADSAYVALRYDSVQSVWQQQLADITLMADTTYSVLRNSSTSATEKFTPHQTLADPYFLITDGRVLSVDTLHIVK